MTSIINDQLFYNIPFYRPPGFAEKNDLLQQKAAFGTLDEVRNLLATGISVSLCNPQGSTALHSAAQRGDRAIYDLLKSKGANSAALTNYGTTPLLIAQESGHAELYKHMKAQDKRVYAYSKELRLRKQLAHLLNIAGTTTLMPPDPKETQELAIPLEGWWPHLFWTMLYKVTQKFFQDNPNSASADILDVCKLATNKQLHTPEELFKRYKQEKKPIVINIGYKGHHSSVILWGSFLVLCDRGHKNKVPFEVRLIDKTKLTENLIRELSSLKTKTMDDYRLFLKNNLSSCFLPDQHSIAIALTHLMFLPQQEIGNCSWANTEAVLYVLFVLHSVRKNALLPTAEQISLTELLNKQRALFDTWQACIIKSQVEKYVNHHLTLARLGLGPEPYYPPDYQFLEKVQQKLPKDLAMQLKILFDEN